MRKFPTTRLRRNRTDQWLRDILQKTHQDLMENGFYVSMIRPSTSPTLRLRISLSALHVKVNIITFAKYLKKE